MQSTERKSCSRKKHSPIEVGVLAAVFDSKHLEDSPRHKGGCSRLLLVPVFG